MVDLRGFSEFEQFPGSDPLGPRPARIVGEPKTVCGKNNVTGDESHVKPRLRMIAEYTRRCTRLASEKKFLTKFEEMTVFVELIAPHFNLSRAQHSLCFSR